MKNSIFLILLLFLIISLSFIKEIKAQLPASYDSRNYGLVTSVKDQGLTCGSCWAFASCTAIESSWLKQGFGSYDLSEDNIIDCHGFDEGPCEGGNYYMVNALLSRHVGILNETDDPYTPDLKNCPYGYPFPPMPAAYVEEIRFIPANIDKIKQAVIDYGAVATTMFMNYTDNSVWDAVNYKYYDTQISSSDSAYAHCVTIVGWNDNMTFGGAPNNGGWIIKDSYGTSWADNGYFYCSFFDDGILSENVVFPTLSEIPNPSNNSIVYYHDKFGWVDNFGYSSNEAYALVKYTIAPTYGTIVPQQIKRIGTWAVEDNTTIEYELYRTKSGNTLSDMISSGSINCEYKGFYTIPLSLPTDTLGSDIYIKIKYSCPIGTLQPIPVEQYEEYHTSSFNESLNSCWVSNDGNTWSLTGQGTSNSFNLCIKMYAESAPKAKINPIPESVCMFEDIILNYESFVFDSLKWYVNDIFIANMPNFPHIFTEPGNTEIKLIVWLGYNYDSDTKNIQVNDFPEPPIITQSENSLISSEAFSYQWFYEDMNPIYDENSQIFIPDSEGTYIVRTGNEFMCYSYSEPYVFNFVNIPELIQNGLSLYPIPSEDIINLIIPEKYADYDMSIDIYDYSGKIVIKTNTSHKQIKSIDIQDLRTGLYYMIIKNKNQIIDSIKFNKI